MIKYHVEFDVEIRKFDEDDNEIGLGPLERPRFEDALYTEIEGLKEMDFDLQIDVRQIGVDRIRPVNP
jgi:hypothetical protein